MVFCIVSENIRSTSQFNSIFARDIFSSIVINSFDVQRYKCQKFGICEEIGGKMMTYTFQDLCLTFRCVNVQTVPCTEYLHIYCSCYLAIMIYSIFTLIHQVLV